MSDPTQSRLERVIDAAGGTPFRGRRSGLEKESLRVTPDGYLAQTPHPDGLGSALTSAHVTTDFSEALLEFVTPPLASAHATLAFLADLHRFAYAHLGEELLWAASMPCMVSGDAGIPIARFGDSNVGTMKHVYRRGLSHRYGRVMQVIAGVHFNFSLPRAFWSAYRRALGQTIASSERAADFTAAGHFALIRNFQRCGWLVPYLFGASPAVCRSFLRGRAVDLDELDRGTLYSPHATSLRMSDIGYKNENQQGLGISYDSLERYVETLARATRTPWPEYEAIGVVVDGEYRQLNANLLQIENEYYSFVRPKQIARSGERPTRALERRGVRYVEMRALDVDPYAPEGVDAGCLRFLEALLVACALADSPPVSDDEQAEIEHNQGVVAARGREPGLRLRRGGGEVDRDAWAGEILDAVAPVCEALDAEDGGRAYRDALAAQRRAVADPERLPSARILAEMEARRETFFEFAMRKSREHREGFLAAPLDGRARRRLDDEARRSLEAQRAIEAEDRLSFGEYLARYFEQDVEAA